MRNSNFYFSWVQDKRQTTPTFLFTLLRVVAISLKKLSQQTILVIIFLHIVMKIALF
jgi:hypothetical protein